MEIVGCTGSPNVSLIQTSKEGVDPFCSSFHDTIPAIYLGISLLSAFCCVWVFATYFLFPRLSGYSSKVFLYR